MSTSLKFILKSKRIRLLNGHRIKSQLRPNDFPLKERKAKAEQLAKKVYDYFKTLWGRFKRASKLIEQDHHYTLFVTQEL
jgi:hypothetical protein